ncbi:hypothetical protein MNBD_GAMMA10-2801 [hydrothermal vent metagenome]|uniref:Prolyl 4-hydroxylase alpha subunit Fe(2+) 2OG dioxygenase domain-containing protein n=1 Tax=hydrothermal vent metagenome TaxID=652676 RepID=A0A3B0XUR9_9ZZZZ
MSQLNHISLHTSMLDSHSSINQQLIDGLNTHIEHSSTRKSHHFDGRYENIYISTEKIPALSQILHAAKQLAASILACSPEDLKAGLWFNVMNPGDKTTLHRHDDDDELLSGVYYVQVSENSGTLLLNQPPVQTRVTPKEGLFVLFTPDMPHEVTENLSQQRRISLGINIGPVHKHPTDKM